jgi:hypothetical protein
MTHNALQSDAMTATRFVLWATDEASPTFPGRTRYVRNGYRTQAAADAEAARRTERARRAGYTSRYFALPEGQHPAGEVASTEDEQMVKQLAAAEAAAKAAGAGW